MSTASINDITAKIDALVCRSGLSFIGIVALEEDPDFQRFETWLAKSQHAGMGFLENHKHLRRDPRGLAPNLKTAIMVGFNYYQGDTRNMLRNGGPYVAQYARLRDYHRVIRDLGEHVLAELPNILGQPVSGRVTTDSAPILERSHAARGGRGFIGKNTCFIQPKEGSFFLLGEILIDAVLPTTIGPPVDPTLRGDSGGCGSCKRCQVNCPTGALDEAWNVDANKCLAYWSIEHRGEVPKEYWRWFGTYLFGCDICQLVCPYNRSVAEMSGTTLLRVDAAPDLYEIAMMDQATYERMFGGTPMTRAKREGLIRNALISMYVTKHPRLNEVLDHYRLVSDVAVVVQNTIAQMSFSGA